MINKRIPMVRRQTTAWEKKSLPAILLSEDLCLVYTKQQQQQKPRPINQTTNARHRFLSGEYRLKLIDVNSSQS